MTTRTPLAERKRLQARERIVSAAEELFAQRGFTAVSVADIAERAEVGRTTFFRHFGDKQEVVFAQEQELIATVEAAQRERDVTTPADLVEAIRQLSEVILALCAQATADPVSYRRHLEFVEQNGELRARDALKLQDFAERLTALLIERGCDRPTAVFASQIALACFQTAKRSGTDPRTLVEDTRRAFDKVTGLAGSASA